jgi:Protein of unknown function (DUF2167)
LAALSYTPGKGYEDFNASTDHIAEYGIAALVGAGGGEKARSVRVDRRFRGEICQGDRCRGPRLRGRGVDFFRSKPKRAYGAVCETGQRHAGEPAGC